MPGSKLNGEILSEMNDRCFGSGIAGRSVVADRSNANTSNGSRDDDAGRILASRFRSEQWSESNCDQQARNRPKIKYEVESRMYSLLNSVKNTLHIQIHHLGEHFLWVGIELLAPRRARIGKQDVNVVCRLANFCG